MQKGKPEKRVSIIVPVYNTERYLDKCLSSLVEQTYGDVEIIAVDDGSTDGSGRICDRYAAEFSKVYCYHTDNQGAGQARNFGIDRSTGDYIMYVDADDYIAKSCVAEAVVVAEQYQADMVEFGKVFMLSSKNIFVDTDKTVRHYRSPQEVRQISGSIQRMIWGKLYKRELALSARFNSRQRGEDACYMAEILEHCGSMVKYNRCLYAYRAYQESLTRGKADLKEIRRNIRQYQAAYARVDENKGKGQDPLGRYIAYCRKTVEDIVYRGEEIISRRQILLLQRSLDEIDGNLICKQALQNGQDSGSTAKKRVQFAETKELIRRAEVSSRASWIKRAYRRLRNRYSRMMGRVKVWVNYEVKI